MAILSCHVSIKLPPKISDGQEFVKDHQIEVRIVTQPTRQGLIGQRRRQVRQYKSAGRVPHSITQHTGLLADGLDEVALPHTALPDHDHVLFSADEIGPGQRLDLQPIDGTGIEQPIEIRQGFALCEAGIAVRPRVRPRPRLPPPLPAYPPPGPDRLSRRQARGRRQGADPAPQPAARGQGWPVLPVGIDGFIHGPLVAPPTVSQSPKTGFPEVPSNLWSVGRAPTVSWSCPPRFPGRTREVGGQENCLRE